MNNYNEYYGMFRRLPEAVAIITGGEKYKSIVGKTLFFPATNGVIVRTEIAGLPKANGECSNPVFAFHIHSGNSCSGTSDDEFADANGHFNPGNCPHPFHAGDLPPIFSASGEAFSMFLTNRFTISEIIGKTLILHSSTDDFVTQPSGNSGEKIACGIITPITRF